MLIKIMAAIASIRGCNIKVQAVESVQHLRDGGRVCPPRQPRGVIVEHPLPRSVMTRGPQARDKTRGAQSLQQRCLKLCIIAKQGIWHCGAVEFQDPVRIAPQNFPDLIAPTAIKRPKSCILSNQTMGLQMHHEIRRGQKILQGLNRFSLVARAL